MSEHLEQFIAALNIAGRIADVCAETIDCLKAENKVLREALEYIKSGSGRAEIFGIEMYRCPQCGAADYASKALAEVDLLRGDIA